MRHLPRNHNTATPFPSGQWACAQARIRAGRRDQNPATLGPLVVGCSLGVGEPGRLGPQNRRYRPELLPWSPTGFNDVGVQEAAEGLWVQGRLSWLVSYQDL